MVQTPHAIRIQINVDCRPNAKMREIDRERENITRERNAIRVFVCVEKNPIVKTYIFPFIRWSVNIGSSTKTVDILVLHHK